jgi:3D (Asp-Asp-Asp) domain-containing protein
MFIHAKSDNLNKNENINIEQNETVKIEDNYIIMQATAYDLSIQSCGKSYSHPSRGITRDGFNLNNKTHGEVWTISSNRFPLGTKLQLEFPESHKNYNGIYTIRDTGNFKENVLDIYLGDFGEKVGKETIKFGRVDVKVLVLE